MRPASVSQHTDAHGRLPEPWKLPPCWMNSSLRGGRLIGKITRGAEFSGLTPMPRHFPAPSPERTGRWSWWP